MFKNISSFTPGLRDALFMFAGVAIFGTILAAPTTLVKDVHFISTFLSYILTLSPAFVYAYLKGKRGEYRPVYKINDPYFGRLNPIVLFALLPLTFIAFQVVVEPVGSIIEAPEWFDTLMKETALGGNIYWSVVTTCICAPILEEVLCRGLILRGMIENGDHPVRAIIWSAFIFGILHLNPWQALPAFLMGILFGWIYYRTRCIWAPIFLHFINNTLSTVLFKIYPDLSVSTTYRELIGDDQIYFAIFAVSIGVLALSFFIITRFVGKRDQYEQKTIISD